MNTVLASGTLPDGPAGTRATLRMMRSIARAGARSLVVRDTATRVIADARVAPMDYRGELRALFTFVRDRIRYTRDPANVELLQTAERTLRVKQGDCDDKATLLAAMIESVGIPASLEFRVIATRKPGVFTHVYVVARVGGELIPLDATLSGAPFGWEFERPVTVGGLSL